MLKNNERPRKMRPPRLLGLHATDLAKGRRGAREIWLWPGRRVHFGPNLCPGSCETYIHVTCPTRVVSKNDSGLGKTEVYGKRKNRTQTLRNKGLSKITFWLGKKEGSRQDATRDACSEPKRPARRLSKNVCGSHLAPVFGKPPLASSDFDQANV